MWHKTWSTLVLKLVPMERKRWPPRYLSIVCGMLLCVSLGSILQLDTHFLNWNLGLLRRSFIPKTWNFFLCYHKLLKMATYNYFWVHWNNYKICIFLDHNALGLFTRMARLQSCQPNNFPSVDHHKWRQPRAKKNRMEPLFLVILDKHIA